MSDETTLLPCPFCGGEAEIHPSNDWDVTFTGSTYFAWCDKCETRGDYYNTEAEAITAWNTRAMHGTLTAEHVREAIEEAKAELLESCEYVGDMGQRKGDVLRAFGKMEQAIADELNAELGSETCNPVETATLENATAHVMECDMCGRTYEHVNGDYEHCPRCGRKAER